MAACTINSFTLVAGSTTGASNSTVGTDAGESPEEWMVHRFYTSWASGTPTVLIQGSPDGAAWFTLDTITATGDVTEIARPFKHLRASWTSVSGALTVNVEQLRASIREAGGII